MEESKLHATVREHLAAVPQSVKAFDEIYRVCLEACRCVHFVAALSRCTLSRQQTAAPRRTGRQKQQKTRMYKNLYSQTFQQSMQM